jgi:DNA-directed RNA polymerase subunit RPC12/RpoP
MSDGIIGNATYKCIKCGAKHYLHEDDFHFEAESGSEREMGAEVQHVHEVDEECHNCSNRIQIKFEAWEYPVGILNMKNQDTSGAEILESDFDIYHAPPKEDEPEDSVKLIKSIIFFRFDAFAEAFVDLWVKSYKKSPQPTAILSFISLLLAVLSLGFAIYSSETARTERLESVQSYSEQFNLLKNTERNLNDLSEFITSKKIEIDVTRNAIQELEAKKSELEPIVTANQKVVDAIFLQQKKAVEKTIWVERWISFGFGVLASLIATIAWHFIGRFKEGRREKQI